MRTFFALVLACAPLTARAETLDDLLEKGVVTLLETKPDGRLSQVTAIGVVDAPIDQVWARLTNFADYKNWMPQVAASKVAASDGQTVDVDITISVVGPNINFRQRFTLDPAGHRMDSVWVSGALEGSHWSWRLEPHGAGTLVHRTLYTNVVDTNWIVRQVEDSNHTMEYGINVATGVVEVRGLKKVFGAR